MRGGSSRSGSSSGGKGKIKLESNGSRIMGNFKLKEDCGTIELEVLSGKTPINVSEADADR